MRGFIGWLLLIAILGALAFVFAPAVARPLVVAGVRASLPFPADTLDVDASVDSLSLLRGEVDRVGVAGADLEVGGSTIGSLDITVRRLGLVDRSFGSIEGVLERVTITRRGERQVSFDRVELSGTSSAVQAEGRLGRDATIQLARRALSDAGLPAGQIELTESGLRITVLGQRADVTIGVVDGAITAAGSAAGGRSIVLFAPEPGEPWRVTGVTASPSGLDVFATLDLEAALSEG